VFNVQNKGVQRYVVKFNKNLCVKKVFIGVDGSELRSVQLRDFHCNSIIYIILQRV
jgi:hypothetical protein